MKTADAIKFYVTQEALAKALGLKQPSVARWVKSGEIPPLRQLQIEALTKGALKADCGILPSRSGKSKCGNAHRQDEIKNMGVNP